MILLKQKPTFYSDLPKTRNLIIALLHDMFNHASYIRSKMLKQKDL